MTTALGDLPGTRGSRWQAAGLAGLLVLATLGEGGGSPSAIVVWHGALVLLLVWAWLSRPAGSSLPAPVVIALGLFGLLFTVGVARAPYGYAAILVALELAACLGVAALAASVGPRLSGILVWPLAGAAALHGALAVHQWFDAEPGRPASTFLNPNHLALWLVVAVLLVAGSARKHGGATRLYLLACGLLAAVGIVASGSRGALLGLIVGGAWLFFVSWRRMPRGWRLGFGVAAIALVLTAVAALLVRQRGYDPFRYQRVKIWSASIVTLLEDPWWGTGPGQFPSVSARYRFPDGDGPLQYDRAHSATHSDWLRVPVELGAPAGLALLAALLYAASHLRRRRAIFGSEPMFDAGLAALLAVGAHALVDNPSRWPAVALLVSALWGCLLSGREESTVAPALSSSRPQGSSLGWRASLATALVLLFVVADVAPFLAWSEVSTLARGRLAPAQLERVLRAVELNPIHPGYRLRVAEHFSALPPRAEHYVAARESAEHAVRLHPEDGVFRLGLARVEARACRTVFRTAACRDRVALHYREAGRLAPFDPAIPLEQAMFLLDLDDPVGARRAATRALGLEPESVLPRLVLADALIETGTSQDLRRAGALLLEAEQKAERWSDWSGPDSARWLLELDRDNLSRMRRQLASGDSPDGAVGAPVEAAGGSDAFEQARRAGENFPGEPRR